MTEKKKKTFQQGRFSHLSDSLTTTSNEGFSSMAGNSESPYRLGRDTRFGRRKGLGVGRQRGWVFGLFL